MAVISIAVNQPATQLLGLLCTVPVKQQTEANDSSLSTLCRSHDYTTSSSSRNMADGQLRKLYIDIHWYKLTPQHLQSQVTHWVESPCNSQQLLTGIVEHAKE